MDYFAIIGYWKEEINGTDNSSSCCMLWIAIPLCGQVSVQIDCLMDEQLKIVAMYIHIVSSQNFTDCVSVWYSWIRYWFFPSDLPIYS